MTIYLGADHRGFKLKERIKAVLQEGGHAFVDVGNTMYDENDDYPDFAQAVAKNVSEHPDDRGIVICGSGFGVDIAANKMPGIRAALAVSPAHITVGRHDDDVNVLALAADFIDEATAIAIVNAFLATTFGGEERYRRRINKL